MLEGGARGGCGPDGVGAVVDPMAEGRSWTRWCRDGRGPDGAGLTAKCAAIPHSEPPGLRARALAGPGRYPLPLNLFAPGITGADGWAPLLDAPVQCHVLVSRTDSATRCPGLPPRPGVSDRLRHPASQIDSATRRPDQRRSGAVPHPSEFSFSRISAGTSDSLTTASFSTICSDALTFR